MASLQLCNDRVLFSPDQSFKVRTVALIESDFPRGVRSHHIFAVRSRGFQVAVLEKQHHNVFIVEVHGRGHARLPGIIPHNDPLVLQQFPGSGPGKGQRITAAIGESSCRMIFQIDHNRAAGNLRLAALRQKSRLAGKSDYHGIQRLRLCACRRRKYP